ncbi:MAG: lysophospholipid acyltransferase family protein [Lentisphaeria bacterium]|nr:lysophospholipid acyltransferase family protein [Lentisphaeria bacterium]
MGYIKQKIRSKQKLPTWLFWFPSVLMRFMLLFYRIRVHDPNHYCQTAQGMIGLMWHNRLMFFAPIFPKIARRRTKAVVSASRDGQYVTDLISFFGLSSLRGSSSKKGAAALRGALEAIHEGWNVAFTPDGPRGPRYEMKPGPVIVASMTGAKIIPMSVNASRYWEVGSWDKFQIPKPFSTLELVLGDAVSVPPDLDAEGLERERLRIQELLRSVTVD